MKGQLAVFAVEHSCFAFPLVMFVLLCTEDESLAGVALNPLEFTATFMLSLKHGQRAFSTAFRDVGQINLIFPHN